MVVLMAAASGQGKATEKWKRRCAGGSRRPLSQQWEQQRGLAAAAAAGRRGSCCGAHTGARCGWRTAAGDVAGPASHPGLAHLIQHTQAAVSRKAEQHAKPLSGTLRGAHSGFRLRSIEHLRR